MVPQRFGRHIGARVRQHRSPERTQASRRVLRLDQRWVACSPAALITLVATRTSLVSPVATARVSTTGRRARPPATAWWTRQIARTNSASSPIAARASSGGRCAHRRRPACFDSRTACIATATSPKPAPANATALCALRDRFTRSLDAPRLGRRRSASCAAEGSWRAVATRCAPALRCCGRRNRPRREACTHTLFATGSQPRS